MNIYGEESNYIRNLIFTFASTSSDDIRGVVENGTLSFIVNFGLLYIITLPNISKDITCTFMRNFEENKSFFVDNCIIDIPNLYNEIISKISTMKEYICTNNPIYVETDLKENPQFNKLDSMKTQDGCMRYYIDSSLNHRSFVTLNKNLFKLNKADTLSLEVFDCGYNRLLYHFTIGKKKYNLLINLYMITCDLY